MKKKILFASAMLFFSILPLAFFTSCDKDTNSYLEVSVTDEATKLPIGQPSYVQLFNNSAIFSDVVLETVIQKKC